jgi:hypothetical protein
MDWQEAFEKLEKEFRVARAEIREEYSTARGAEKFNIETDELVAKCKFPYVDDGGKRFRVERTPTGACIKTRKWQVLSLVVDENGPNERYESMVEGDTESEAVEAWIPLGGTVVPN